MAGSLVQATSKQVSGVSSTTISFASSVTAGSFIAVFTTSWFNNSSSATDNQSGNSYSSLVAGDVGGASPFVRILGAHNVAASGTFTVTVNFAGSADATIIIAELSGVATSSAAEVANYSTGSSSSPSVSTSGATTDAGDMLIGMLTHDGSTMAITETYSLIAEQENNSSSQGGSAQYRLPGSTGTHSLTWTLASSAGWIAAVVALKPAASASVSNVILSPLRRFGFGGLIVR